MTRWTQHLSIYLLSLYALAVPRYSYADLQEFWQHWSDGQAEVNTYTLTQPRYGEPRVGQLHLIYVTEPFSKSTHVKVDQYDPKHIDHTIALKLNIVESWQTGVYEYRLMTSQFYDAQDQLTPLKTVFSSQEWCGASYEELHWYDGQLLQSMKSYFEGESQTQKLPSNVRSADQLLVIIRGLQTGGPQSLKSLPKYLIDSSKVRFLTHQPAQVFPANIKVSDAHIRQTELGPLPAHRITFQRNDRSMCTLYVESISPYRILSWSCADGERAEIKSSRRIPYWQMTKTRDQQYERVKTSK